MCSSPYFIGDSLLLPDVEYVLETYYTKFNVINTLSEFESSFAVSHNSVFILLCSYLILFFFFFFLNFSICLKMYTKSSIFLNRLHCRLSMDVSKVCNS